LRLEEKLKVADGMHIENPFVDQDEEEL